jgi:hypothetical protein
MTEVTELSVCQAAAFKETARPQFFYYRSSSHHVPGLARTLASSRLENLEVKGNRMREKSSESFESSVSRRLRIKVCRTVRTVTIRPCVSQKVEEPPGGAKGSPVIFSLTCEIGY